MTTRTAPAPDALLGELDLHLLREGRHEQLWRVLGANRRGHVPGTGESVSGESGTGEVGTADVQGVSFAVWAPNARAVRVVGDFNDWDGSAHPLRLLGDGGVWAGFVPGVPDGCRYKYEILTRQGRWIQKADPLAAHAESAPGTASRVFTSDYAWGDADWMAERGRHSAERAPMSVYELHLASWRPGLSYRRLAEELPAYVKALGFTHVELLPIAEHPFGGSWGYQVSSYYAPMSRLGDPDDFRFLVDSLHQAGIGVILDWVPAHFPKDDWALARFDGTPLYEHPDPRRGEHPDWGTLIFDFGRPEVRNFLVANAVYWCQEFHVDGLRVDAVASMLYLDYSRGEGQWQPNAHGGRENLEARAFLQEMNATVYRRCPGVVTIAEESTAWDGVTRPTDHGGLGFGLKWNMGWMHDTLGYMAEDPVNRQYHHHAMTFPMVYAYSENYALPISHDEVVHGKGSLLGKMPGDRWQRFANLRAYLAFMWAFPGKQLLFMGQEFAQESEWSHDLGPDWAALQDAAHAAVRRLVQDLNRQYQALPALWSQDSDAAGFRWIDADAVQENTYSFIRYDQDGEPLVCVFNFQPSARPGFRLALPESLAGSRWVEVLNTDAAAYGGSGAVNPGPLHGDGASLSLLLPPLGAVWLRPDRS
nr:1,4-alpha-glucan branching protein GlgB [Streptacidiphilus fuscans]